MGHQDKGVGRDNLSNSANCTSQEFILKGKLAFVENTEDVALSTC